MNQFELRSAEQEIRATLVGTGLEWVLDEVDAAIAAGVPEERVLRRRPQRGGWSDPQPGSPTAAAAQYETLVRDQINGDDYEASRKRGTLVITTRGMTDEERVQLLLDALRRVLVELPEIEMETIKTLATSPEGDKGTRVELDEVTFHPDENARRESFAVYGDRVSQVSRNRISTLLADVTREVQS